MYLLCLVVFGLTLWYLWSRRSLYKLAHELNGPLGYPFIGSAYSFLDATKVVECMQTHGDKYGNMSKLWIGNNLFVYVDDPSHIEAILNSPKCLNKGGSYRFIENFVGMGLITMRGDDWKIHRKLLNPSFHYNIVNKFIPIFNKHLRTMVDNLKTMSGQFDIHQVLKSVSMDLICETTMDRQMNAQMGENDEYLAAIDKTLEISGCRMFNPVLQPNGLFRISKYYSQEQNCVQILKDTVADIIERKNKGIQENGTATKQKQCDEDIFFGKEKHIFIDRVLKLAFDDKTFSLDDAMNETNTVLLAGYETTATTSAFVLLMLAMHPEYQDILFEEFASIDLSGTVDITNDVMSELKICDMFIKETLRLFPAVPYFTRTTTSDFEVGGHIIPAGVEFLMSCIYMHRSNKHFSNPNVFDPNNFLPEKVGDRHVYSYLPFSGGSRNCIGIRYANSVLKMITIYVVKNFQLSTSLKMEDLKFRMNITLNLLNKHLVTIKRRQ